MSLYRSVKFNRICILAAMMVFVLTLSGCASSNSSSNKKNDVKESKRTEKVSNTPVKNKSDFTVDDLKQHPKMSATAITLYGDTHIQKDQKGKVSSKDEADFERGFGLAVESVNSTTAKYYTNSDKISQFSYYSLVGSNHDQVTYYNTQDKTLLKTSLSDVISYLNKTLTNAEMTSIADSINISMKTKETTDNNINNQSWNVQAALKFLKSVNDASSQGASIINMAQIDYAGGTSTLPIDTDSGATAPPNSVIIGGVSGNGSGSGRRSIVLIKYSDNTVTMILCNEPNDAPYLTVDVSGSDYKILRQDSISGVDSLTDYFGGSNNANN
ncbi:hypothetical protein [Furfurilactobacillus rossiae]|uniref:hypothetical protein n=1 Tax=Furfurilactobacillus rossiae TaxID=231049 RepID=UPI0002F93058|nr:hypothetical protein [Furfurilactobacillus rossiae]